jgi:hypothetical protein
MSERLRTFLLIATLMSATAGATAGILGLKAGARDATMTVRFGQEPGEGQGWRLMPPSDVQDCDPDDYAACGGDDGDDGEPLESDEDNKPMRI